MNSQWMDVHGAGAQRSDPKEYKDISDLDQSFQLAPKAQGGWATIHGPQGDVVRNYNYVRCVRCANCSGSASNPSLSMTPIYLLLLN